MFFYAKARAVQVRTVIAERRSEVSYDQKKTDVSTYVLPMRQLELLYIMLCGFRMQPVCVLPIVLPGRPPGDVPYRAIRAVFRSFPQGYRDP